MDEAAREGRPAMTHAADEIDGEQKSPEELRQEIAETREGLGDTVEALAEKTDVKAQAKAGGAFAAGVLVGWLAGRPEAIARQRCEEAHLCSRRYRSSPRGAHFGRSAKLDARLTPPPLDPSDAVTSPEPDGRVALSRRQ